MTLDDLQKITTILFSSVGTFVLGYFTLTGQWREFALQEDRFCIDTESYYIQAALRSEQGPSQTLLMRIKDRCGFGSLVEARQTFQAEKAGFQQLASDGSVDLVEPVIEGETTGTEAGAAVPYNEDGWVALGRKGEAADQNNFTSTDGSATDATSGAVLAARWPVNLRLNTQITTGGTNPSLSIVETGDCVKLVDDTQIHRNIIWAPVARSVCSEES